MRKQLMVMMCGTCLFLMVSSTKTNAQIKFGPVVGVNFNDMTGDVDSDGMLVGFHIGALVNFGIGDFLMIEPQVLYSTRGAKGKDDNLNLDYIEIPIWVRYQMSGGLNFNAGPYAGILVGAKVGDTDYKDRFTGTDFGLGFGIGYQTSGGIGFAANYSQSLGNVGEDTTPFSGNLFHLKPKTPALN